MIKIRNGTPRSDVHLCRSCNRAVVARGPRLNDEIIRCYKFDEEIKFPVHFCNSYIDNDYVSVEDMREHALYIDVNKKTGRVGFKHYGDLPDAEKYQDFGD